MWDVELDKNRHCGGGGGGGGGSGGMLVSSFLRAPILYKVICIHLKSVAVADAANDNARPKTRRRRIGRRVHISRTIVL